MATDESAGKGPEWFSIREAAAYLNVGEPTIYRWMREGKITYRKVGDSTRFFREDLDSVIEVHPSDKDADSATEFCPLCHGTDLVDGDARSTGRLHFHPADARFWTLKDSAVDITARMCAKCGFVVLRGDTGKLAAPRPAATPESNPWGEEEKAED